MLVILDPGHGGEDAGAVHGRVVEKDLTLSLAREAARQLKARGVRVALTRQDDSFVDLDRRAAIANLAAARAKNALFVSIHANSSAEGAVSGIETYVLNAATNDASRRLAELENGHRFGESRHATVDLILSDLATTANFSRSVGLACQLQAAASADTGARDRGVRAALFYVLMQTRMPGVLFEPGFVSNPGELRRLASPAYQRRLARALMRGILGYRAGRAKTCAIHR